jgi:RNA polymerase sigma factor (sigma-70 family)
MSGRIRISVYEGEEERNTVSEDPDLALVMRAQAGEEEAFAELDRRYRSRITAFVTQRLPVSSDVPDEVQEIFIKVFRFIGGFRFNSKFSTWLYSIAKNRCNDHLRRRIGMESRTFSLEQVDCERHLTWDADRAAQMSILEKVFGEMDERKQDIIKRLYQKGELATEIAVDLNMKPQQIRDVNKAFCRKLWKEMEAQGYERCSLSGTKRG